jgi:hypothetical protein
VVITIIVLLLAMLAPALDRAVYEAELATCAAQTRGHIAGVQSYAFDHKRSYPTRTSVGIAWTPWPQMLKGKNNNNQQWYDDRPKLKAYVPAKFHRDPLAATRTNVYEDENEFSLVWSTYALWYGWRFVDSEMGGRGSMRLGDPFEWNREKFNVLVTDWDHAAPPQSYASHPDRRSILDFMDLLNNETIVINAPGVPQATGYVITGAFWWRRQAVPAGGRGYIDTNHGFDDNSVVTHRSVPYDVNPIYGYNGEGRQVANGRPYEGGVTRVGSAAGADAASFNGGSHYQVSRR